MSLKNTISQLQAGKGNQSPLLLLGRYQQEYLDQYFERIIGISSPKVSYVDKYAINQPCYDFKSDMWVALATAELYTDIEIIGSIVKDAEIVIYFAPREATGLLAALKTAIQEKIIKTA